MSFPGNFEVTLKEEVLYWAPPAEHCQHQGNSLPLSAGVVVKVNELGFVKCFEIPDERRL